VGFERVQISSEKTSDCLISSQDSVIGLSMSIEDLEIRGHSTFIEEVTEKPQEGEFGRMIRQLCREKGFTQRSLAETAGINKGYLNRAIKGLIPISVNSVYQLADILRASPTELLEAAGKLAEFPYDLVESDPELREVCRKLAEGELLTSGDKDELLRLKFAWMKPSRQKHEK
jgi:transcriptional regulator with XRE-family HTH domain